MRHGVGRVRLGGSGLLVLPRSTPTRSQGLRYLPYELICSVQMDQRDSLERGSIILTLRRGERIVICYPHHQFESMRALYCDLGPRVTAG